MFCQEELLFFFDSSSCQFFLHSLYCHTDTPLRPQRIIHFRIMIILNSLLALTVGVALSHALNVSPYKGKPVPPYRGKFFCDDSHWLESPPCCKVSAEFHDECEPCITDYPSAKPCCGNAKPGLTTRMTDYEFVGKPSEMEPFDPCFRRHGGLIPACCILSEEGRVRMRVWRVEADVSARSWTVLTDLSSLLKARSVGRTA